MRRPVCLIWLCLVPSSTFGAIVYDFESGTGVGTSSDPAVLISNFSGSGVTGLGFTGPGNPGLAVRGHTFHVGSSVANSNYFYFDISLDPNTLLELTSLTFDEFAENGPGPHRGPTMFQIRVNGTAIGSAQATNFGSYGSTHNVDLSFLQYVGGTVRVELHGWGAHNNNANNEWFIDNVNLGFETSAVPEPTTSILLLGSMGLFFVLRRRSFRQRSVTA